MERIAEFMKVSKEEFAKSFGTATQEAIDELYDNVVIPTRATQDSAGYDFVSPVNFTLYPGENIIIPTGIRCKINSGWFLAMYIRSSLGFKNGARLRNGTGIIDGDYFYADNEGHIMLKITTEEVLEVSAGDRIAQGVFTTYGITVDDEATGVRDGGFGSTGK